MALIQANNNRNNNNRDYRWNVDEPTDNTDYQWNSSFEDTVDTGGGGGGGLNPELPSSQLFNIVISEKDSSPKKFVKNATVIYDTATGSFTHTNNEGKASWEFSVPTCFCDITAPGYKPISNRKVNAFSASNPFQIEMEPIESTYHFKIIVKDKNTNKTIEGASIDIAVDPDKHNVTISDGSFVYCSDLQTIDIGIIKNGYRSIITQITGYDSFGQAESNPTIIYLTPVNSAHYYYVLYVKDNTGSPVEGVTFNFYSDFGFERPYTKNETGTTNSSGYISMDIGQIDFVPANIYAKGVSVPPGYTWGSVNTGAIQATLLPLKAGCTITVNTTTVSSTYYYNIRLVDDTTDQGIQGATVKYLNGTSVLKSTTTDSSGYARFSSELKNLTVQISKLEYNTGYENGITYGGSSDPTSCRLIKVFPKNTVQVLYDYGQYTEPAPNVLVKVFTHDNLGNYMPIGTYKTLTNGYIQNLSDAYYTSGKVYLSVVGYSKVYTLTPGQFIIKIAPPSNDTPDESNTGLSSTYSDYSASGIKKKLEIGNSELKSTGKSNNVTYNTDDFRIKILDPESITTLDIFTSKPVMMQDENKNVIGSVDVALKPDVNNLRLKVINRYSGYYNPIFKDILFYNSLPKKNLDVFPYSNTSFDYNYEDNYGKFGYINNLWFHKVNDNKEMEIIKTLTPYYPLTGQYALDFRDFNIFSSNWDMNYYTRQLDAQHSEPCQNISSMKNKPSMFGSKCLNVPNRIEITGLTLGNDRDWFGEWNDEWITNPDGCPGEMMFKEINDNSVDFYFFFKKRILRYFYEKLKDLFEQKIESDQFSFGKKGIEDDIYEYVTKNILKLYRLEKVRVFVRRTKKGRHNSRIENDYTSYVDYVPGRPDQPMTVNYLKSHGFVEIKNATMTKLNRDDFDRKLVYNLWNGTKEDFSFSLVLKKI